ncbi:hypothetical protein [Laspinema olomoucense]|uniref:hypothetical protein n=1 Tax=Laspinema olomoucense TaxID=3231600 RepID=UPI0021BB0663|nr:MULTISPECIES: hypothetical protein [unclassified Laspinema]MCT7971098.1 hypothetical protein [Laspinema sp. D3d]MCT7987626.1 hypothetical protein [Laspinema sp. D3a]
MKITKIGYGYTQSLGNYENAKLYAEIESEDRDAVEVENTNEPVEWISPEEACSKLRDWVHSQLPHPSKVQDLKSEAWTIERKIDQGIEALTRLRNKWDEAIAILEKHGITITEEFPWKPEAPEPPPEVAKEGNERGRTSEHF